MYYTDGAVSKERRYLDANEDTSWPLGLGDSVLPRRLRRIFVVHIDAEVSVRSHHITGPIVGPGLKKIYGFQFPYFP